MDLLVITRALRRLLPLFALSLSVAAQSAPAKYLLPVFVSPDAPIPGAHESQWVTHLTITNRGDSDVRLHGIIPCPGTAQCPPPPPLPPGSTHTVTRVDDAGVLPGHAFTVAGDAAKVDVVLRAQDLSRQSQTWGTTIPVVPEQHFVSDSIGLSDVAVSPEFRSLVRIYDLHPSRETIGGGQVKLRIYAYDSTPAPDVLLSEHVVRLAYQPPFPGTNPYEPGYAEFSLWQRPELSGHERVRVEIQADSPNLSFWAFVAITNNVTQHVTMVTPTIH
jgi:hypothetical protein